MQSEGTGYLFRNGKILDFPTIISKNIDYSRKTGCLRIRTTLKEVNVDFLEECKPTFQQISTIKQQVLNGKTLVFEIVDKNNTPLKGKGSYSKSINEMQENLYIFYNSIY